MLSQWHELAPSLLRGIDDIDLTLILLSSDASLDEGLADGPAQGILTCVEERAHPDSGEVDLATSAHGGNYADVVLETVFNEVSLGLCVVDAIDHVVRPVRE